MKKSILNLGKALNKAEQKLVKGGDVAGMHCNNPGEYCDPHRLYRCEPILLRCISKFIR